MTIAVPIRTRDVRAATDEQPDQLRDRRRPFAHDLPALALRGRDHRHELEAAGAQRRRLDVEGLLFRRHDPFERGITRLVQALVGREDRRERELDHFHAAFDLPLGCASLLVARQVEMRDRRDTRQVEQLRHHRADLMVVVVDRHLAEQDQVVPAVLQLGSQRFRHLREGQGTVREGGGVRVRDRHARGVDRVDVSGRAETRVPHEILDDAEVKRLADDTVSPRSG